MLKRKINHLNQNSMPEAISSPRKKTKMETPDKGQEKQQAKTQYPEGMGMIGRADKNICWGVLTDQNVTPKSKKILEKHLSEQDITVLAFGGLSPGSTKYKARLRMGPFDYCTPATPPKKPKIRPKRLDFLLEEENPKELDILPKKTRTLNQKFTVTPEALKQQQQKMRRRGKKRLVEQKELFNGISANVAAKEMGLKKGENETFEYSHFIAFCFAGDDAQKKDNLGLTPKALNTYMLFVEKIILKLVSQDITVSLDVTATIDCSTELTDKYHVIEKIDYEVTFLGKCVKFGFYPDSLDKPPVDFFKALVACFETVEERGMINMNAENEETTPHVSTKCSF